MREKETNIPYRAQIGTVLLLLLISCAFMIAGGIGMPSLIGLLFLTAGGGFLGYSFLLTGNYFVFFAAPVSFAGVWLLTGTPVEALSLLIAVGAAVALGQSRRTDLTKSRLVVGVTAAMGIGGIVWLLAKFYAANGIPTPGAIKNVFGDYVIAWKQIGYELVQAMRDNMGEEMLSQYGTLFSNDAIDGVVETLASMLLGAAIALWEGLAYAAVCLVRGLCRICKTPLLAAQKPYFLVVSRTCALIYTICYALSVFVTGQTAVVVCMNLIIILAPGLFVTGLNYIGLILRLPPLRKAKVGAYVLGGIVLLVAPGVLCSIVIFMGCWGAVTAKHIRRV